MGLTDIRKYRPEPGIAEFSYNMEFELQEAAVARDISPLELAEMPGIQLWLKDESDMCKADLLVWYRLKNQIEATSNDLQSKHIKRLQAKARMNRNGR